MRKLLIAIAALTLASQVGPAIAEEPEIERQSALDEYVRLLSDHFRLPRTEVRILTEGRVTPDELPVVLRLSRFSGIPPVSVLSQRRTGASWSQIAGRYGLGAAAFHVAIPDAQVDASIARVQTLFRDSPPSSWDSIELTDAEYVTLANLLVLSSELGVSHGRLLEARATAGSFVAAVPALLSAP